MNGDYANHNLVVFLYEQDSGTYPSREGHFADFTITTVRLQASYLTKMELTKLNF